MKNATPEQVAENTFEQQEKVKTADSILMRPECSTCMHDHCPFNGIEPDFCVDYKMDLNTYMRKFFGELRVRSKNLFKRKEK